MSPIQRYDLFCGRHPGDVTGYAYETVPNKAIVTGKKKGADADQIGDAVSASVSAVTPTRAPAGLGRLAQGASGLTAWRKRDARA
jgi:hypothetical protein